MTRLVEGVNASYVGPDDPVLGVARGDRCYILSDEGSVYHVRWLASRQYGVVRKGHLIADRVVPDRFDEFAFEAGVSPTAMRINVEAVHRTGGAVALLEALESEGHLDSLRLAARRAVSTLRSSIANDESWMFVREALGPAVDDLERTAMIAAVEHVIASDECIEEGEVE